jgi:hypothetical protein
MKQAPREWNNKFLQYITKIGFRPTSTDECIYVRTQPTCTILALYVDNFIIGSAKIMVIHLVIKQLSKTFEMTDMGELRWYLGMRIERMTNNDYEVDQKQCRYSRLVE